MYTKRFPALALLLALILSLSACSDKNPETAAAAPSLTPPAQNTDNPAPPESVGSFSGALFVEHQLDVLAQRDGVISKLNADIGTRVSAGDVLAELDNRQLAADLEAARSRSMGTEAELKSWQSEAKVLDADYERAQKMYDAHLIPLEQFEHSKYKAEEEHWEVQRVEHALATAKATQQSLELEMEKTFIRAPFSGVVARRYIRDRQQVARGDRLFWITGDGPLRMRFTVPEKFIGRIRNRMQLPLTTPDLPDQSYKSEVIEVSPVIDPSSGTFEVMVEVEQPVGALRPGMSARVNLDMQR